MTAIIDKLDRRGFLKLSAILSGMAAMSSSAIAADTAAQTSLRFLINYRGKKFGVKIIPLRNGVNLLSIRELAGKRRFVYAFNFSGPDTNSVPIGIGKQQYRVVKQGDWFTTNVPGLQIGPPEAPASSGGQNIPAELSAGTRGIWQKIKNAAKAVGAAVVVAVVAVSGGNAKVSLGGGDEVYVEQDSGGVHVEVQIDGDRVQLTTNGQVMLPPPGVPEQPGTWY